MEICAKNHDEIVYEGGRYSPCPLCVTTDKIADLEKELEKLEQEIQDHNCEILPPK